MSGTAEPITARNTTATPQEMERLLFRKSYCLDVLEWNAVNTHYHKSADRTDGVGFVEQFISTMMSANK